MKVFEPTDTKLHDAIQGLPALMLYPYAQNLTQIAPVYYLLLISLLQFMRYLQTLI
jgi:hypothetical protein